MESLRGKIAVFLIMFMMCVSTAWGVDKNIYISDVTDPQEDGSIGRPYDTMSDINWTTGGDNSITDWVDGGHTVYINLKAGSVWNETITVAASGVSGRPITIRAYGSGTSPKLHAFQTINAGNYSWVESSTNDEWYCLESGGDPGWNDYYDGGSTDALIYAGLLFKNTIAMTEGKPYYGDTLGSLASNEWDYGNNDSLGYATFYVQSTTDPDSWTNDILEVSTKTSLISISNRDYITVDGIMLRGGEGQSIVITGTCNDVIIQNCHFFDVQDGILVYSGANIQTGIQVLYCHFYHDKTNNVVGKSVQFTDMTQNSTVRGCKFFNSYHGGVEVTETTVMANALTGNVVEFNYFEWNWNTYYGRAMILDGPQGQCTGNHIRYNWIERQAIQSQLNGNGNMVYYNVWNDGQRNLRQDSESGYTYESRAIGLSSYDSAGVDQVCEDNLYYGNVVYNSYQEALCFYGSSGGDVVENNVVINNIFMNCDTASGWTQLYYVTGPLVGNQVVEDNIFYHSSSSNTVYYNGGISVATADSTITGWDSNLSGNPDFVDAAGGNFRLTSVSPAINAGQDLGDTYTYAFDFRDTAFPFGVLNQDDYSSGWDIGVFVYSPYIKGTVTDSKGKPVIGKTVYVTAYVLVGTGINLHVNYGTYSSQTTTNPNTGEYWLLDLTNGNDYFVVESYFGPIRGKTKWAGAKMLTATSQ